MLKNTKDTTSKIKRPQRLKTAIQSWWRLGLLAAVATVGVITIRSCDWSERSQLKIISDESSQVLPIVELEPLERQKLLSAIATTETPTTDRNRARYLLATDSLAAGNGEAAIELLENLEQTYPALSTYILLQRGLAYQSVGDQQQAQQTWLQLIETESESAAAAQALYWLGETNPQYWQTLQSEFPQHPLTHQLAREQLQANPDQFELLLLLAKYDREGQTNTIRDRLVLEYPTQLEPEDWQAIADGYWQAWEYGKAADAYRQSYPTPRNLYRRARGLQINGNRDLAIRAYQRLAEEFYDAPEAAIGMLRLAELVDNRTAQVYLDTVIDQFPEQAPQALQTKIEIFEANNQQEEVRKTAQLLLEEYPQSQAAAEYRWQVARQLAEEGNLRQAWEWAYPITTENIESAIAPKAAFWVGKWAQELDRPEDARASFQYVLSQYPESYYAWRSAVMLGLNVGDFTTVRDMKPDVELLQRRFVPPAGSEIFQELYLLGQDEAAWMQLQAEIGDRQDLTAAEQFTTGVLLQRAGHIREGISRIWNLSQREDPQVQQQWQELRKQPEYWYGLFPFPYRETIVNYANEYGVNPMLVVSVMRQESRFDPNISSSVGATGLMQIIPSTAEWVALQIDLDSYSLTDPDNNINMGSWYLRHNHRRYEDNSMLAIASYNAGSGNVSSWIERFNYADPDEFVEDIPFPETKDYVESVFSNYWNYLRIYSPETIEMLAPYEQTESQS